MKTRGKFLSFPLVQLSLPSQRLTMPFQPIITVSEIPKNSEYVIIQDATLPYNITTNPTGFGTPGGPASIAAITTQLMQIQYFGELPALISVASLSGDLSTGLKAVYKLRDGVHIIHGLYGVSAGNTYTVSVDKLSLTFPLTGSAFDNAFINIGYISDSLAPETLYRIKELDNTTGKVTLFTEWNLGTGVTITKYWDAAKYVLVVNCGNANVVKDIANMPMCDTDCDPKAVKDIMGRVILKMSAQIEFSCGRYSKAHYAAALACKKTFYTPCISC